jgi:hypothetical protein
MAMDNTHIDIAIQEVYQLIEDNQLYFATKKVMDIATNFGIDNSRRIEALDIIRTYNAWRADARAFPGRQHTQEDSSRIVYRIGDFLDQIKTDLNSTILKSSGDRTIDSGYSQSAILNNDFPHMATVKASDSSSFSNQQPSCRFVINNNDDTNKGTSKNCHAS